MYLVGGVIQKRCTSTFNCTILIYIFLFFEEPAADYSYIYPLDRIHIYRKAHLKIMGHPSS